MKVWNVILGVDVSKKTLDICCAERRLPVRIDNNSEGFSKLKKWCKDNEIDLNETFNTNQSEPRAAKFCPATHAQFHC
jgi:hypothetical protein